MVREQAIEQLERFARDVLPGLQPADREPAASRA
jgi:hypothetical protein